MLKNSSKSQLKNELTKCKEAYDELAKAHLDLQRTIKRVLLTTSTYYSYDTARYYTNHELDNMRIELVDNEEEMRIELEIKK